ncbi:MAG: helix-turn-helix domain-containing protein, partial [Sphaerochaetaceae bacterium]|nr:helix-turn-helix domain-containing protein [Sphaerochaetaceae bacterium]
MGIKEIAKKANVSVTTVSLALNGRKGVSEKTRELISRIAQEEGYRVPSDREIATTDNGIILFAQLTR